MQAEQSAAAVYSLYYFGCCHTDSSFATAPGLMLTVLVCQGLLPHMCTRLRALLACRVSGCSWIAYSCVHASHGNNAVTMGIACRPAAAELPGVPPVPCDDGCSTAPTGPIPYRPGPSWGGARCHGAQQLLLAAALLALLPACIPFCGVHDAVSCSATITFVSQLQEQHKGHHC